MSKNTPIPDFNAVKDELFKSLPHDVSNMALAHFKGSFWKQGFTDTSFIPWVKRQDDVTMGTNHPILNKSLALRDSIRIDEATMKRIALSAGDGLAYAAIHNNGGKITVKLTPKMRKYFWFIYLSLTKGYAHGSQPPEQVLKWKLLAISKKDTLTIEIPQRKYIGNSEYLLRNIDKYISNKILTAFKNAPKRF